MSNTTTDPLDMAVQYAIEAGLLDNVRTLGIEKGLMNVHIRYDGSDQIYMTISRCGFRTDHDGNTTLNFDWDTEHDHGSVSTPVNN